MIKDKTANPVRAWVRKNFKTNVAFAQALGYEHASTCARWTETGRIPYWRKDQISDVCRKMGIKVPNNIFSNPPAAR